MRAPLKVLMCLVPVLASGCGEGVREDRTITWSADGQSTSFQHGDDGVFVSKDGKLEKVFQPDENVIATSTPNWSPDGKQLIFTTAKDPQGRPNGWKPSWDENPEGRVFGNQPAVYTCWLRKETDDGQPTEPQRLFQARVNHVGYVAADLAVRWHPSGERIIYLNRVNQVHGVFEYDIKSQSSRQIFPHMAEAVIFDWTPNDSILVCVLSSANDVERTNGIWMGDPRHDDWWHIPVSSASIQPVAVASPEDVAIKQSTPSHAWGIASIERLCAMRPTWTPDGIQFAFVELSVTESSKTYQVVRGHPQTRAIEKLAEFDQPLKDLHWSPSGERLGFIKGDTNATLHVLSQDHQVSKAINSRPVRRFAGWDATENHVAYVVPDEIPFSEDEKSWAFLIVADPRARDALFVADGHRNVAGNEVFSGMRVTFPHWSPRDNKLSFWATFSPTHASWFSFLFRWGLRPGDPAAVIDLETGKVNWMPIHAREKVQVGHYYLLARKYEIARRWYDEAEGELPPPAPPTLDDFSQLFENSRNLSFFHSYCLKKLGLEEESRAKLAQFRRNFLPEIPALDSNEPTQREQQVTRRQRQLLDPKGLWGLLLRDFYMAEVFLSLDAADDGGAFFDEFLRSDHSDRAKFSAAVVLAQILLLQQKHLQYVELVNDHIMPLLLGQWTGLPNTATLDLSNLNEPVDDYVMLLVGGTTLAPLYSPDFLENVPSETLRTMTTRWESFRRDATDDVAALGIDLFLCEAYGLLGRSNDQKTVAERLRRNAARVRVLPSGDVKKLIQSFRETRAVSRLFGRSTTRAPSESTESSAP